VSAIVSEATGMMTLKYARAKVFTPLGIARPRRTPPVAAWDRIGVKPGYSRPFDTADFAWAVTENRITNGCCMLKLKLDDTQRSAACTSIRGRLDGQQLLPADWVELATTASETSGEYASFWWLENAG